MTEANLDRLACELEVARAYLESDDETPPDVEIALDHVEMALELIRTAVGKDGGR